MLKNFCFTYNITHYWMRLFIISIFMYLRICVTKKPSTADKKSHTNTQPSYICRGKHMQTKSKQTNSQEGQTMQELVLKFWGTTFLTKCIPMFSLSPAQLLVMSSFRRYGDHIPHPLSQGLPKRTSLKSSSLSPAILQKLCENFRKM